MYSSQYENNKNKEKKIPKVKRIEKIGQTQQLRNQNPKSENINTDPKDRESRYKTSLKSTDPKNDTFQKSDKEQLEELKVKYQLLEKENELLRNLNLELQQKIEQPGGEKITDKKKNPFLNLYNNNNSKTPLKEKPYPRNSARKSNANFEEDNDDYENPQVLPEQIPLKYEDQYQVNQIQQQPSSVQIQEKIERPPIYKEEITQNIEEPPINQEEEQEKIFEPPVNQEEMHQNFIEQNPNYCEKPQNYNSLEEEMNPNLEEQSKKPELDFSDSILKDQSELNLLSKRIGQSEKFAYNLIYKATKHGDSAETFHKLCDDIGNTVVFIETINNHRFGGYTTKSWKPIEGENIVDDQAFVFSLDRKEIYNIIPGEEAIGCYFNFGPVFCGCQIRIYDGAFEHGGSTYLKGANYDTPEDFVLNGGEQTFGIKEIEVYQVKILD